MTDAQIKAAYERNADTNAFTDVLKQKLEDIPEGGGTGSVQELHITRSNRELGSYSGSETAIDIQDIAHGRLVMESSHNGDIVLSVEDQPFVEKISTSIKVLSVGNSFSADMFTRLPSLIKQLGYNDAVFGYMEGSGTTLEQYHGDITSGGARSYYESINGGTYSFTNQTLQAAIAKNEWDVIIFQQASGSSGQYGTITPYLQDLIDYAKLHCTNAEVEIGWQNVWPYSSTYDGGSFGPYNDDQITMFNAQVNVQKLIWENYSDVKYIIPNTAMIQVARSIPLLNAIGDELTRDGFHLDLEESRFLASLGVVMSLMEQKFGVDYRNILYSELPAELTAELSEAEFNSMMSVASAVRNNPVGLTDLSSGSTNLALQKKLQAGEGININNNVISVDKGALGVGLTQIQDLEATTTTLTMSGNTVYEFGVLESLNIAAFPPLYEQSLVRFSSGKTEATVVSFPAKVRFVGEEPTFAVDKDYILRIQHGVVEVLVLDGVSQAVDPASDYLQLSFTGISGYVFSWTEAGVRIVESNKTWDNSGDSRTFATDPKTPDSSVYWAGSTLGKQRGTHTNPLTVPAGSYIEILEGAQVAISQGTALTLGTYNSVYRNGPDTVDITEDSVIALYASAPNPELTLNMTTEMDNRVKVWIPKDKWAQASNNES